MKIGAALVLLAVGAVLRFAVTTVASHGINVHTVGDILMIVGAIGLILWLIIWAPWAGRRRYPDRDPLDEPESRSRYVEQRTTRYRSGDPARYPDEPY